MKDTIFVNGKPHFNCGIHDKIDIRCMAEQEEVLQEELPQNAVWKFTANNGVEIPEVWDQGFLVPDGTEFTVTVTEGKTIEE